MSIVEAPADVFPTHLELPDTDGKPVDNSYQPYQSMLLTSSLTPLLDRFHPDGNYFIGADNGIYWRRTEKPLEGCKVPDWFYVPNVPRLLNGVLRRSYVLWQEYAHPLIVIEYVSGDGAEERDTTPNSGKFWVYERIIQPSYYVIHDPVREELSVYELVRGQFQVMSPTKEGRFRIVPLEIDLGIWQGEYFGGPAAWLRAWDWDGSLILSSEELKALEQQRAEYERNRADQERNRADQERNRAEQERIRAEHERNRADKLTERLRELGINPDTV